MTTGVRVYSKTPFSEWVRLYGPSSEEWGDAIDIEDVDYIVFNYLTGDLMTLEEKQQNKGVSRAQGDTHHVLSQLLSLSSGSVVDTLRGSRKITYHGHHLIQFENTGPEDGAIRLDGKHVTRDELIQFINFGKCLRRYEIEPGNMPFDGDIMPNTQTTLTEPEGTPAYPCPVCKSTDWWWRPACEQGPGDWLCGRCHPQPRATTLANQAPAAGVYSSLLPPPRQAS